MRRVFPRLLVFLVALALVRPLTAAREGAATRPSEQDRLQGRWRVTGGEQDGKPIPAEKVAKDRSVIEVKGDKWVVRRGDGSDPEVATVKLDETKDPKQIDLTGPYRGPYKGPGSDGRQWTDSGLGSGTATATS